MLHQQHLLGLVFDRQRDALAVIRAELQRAQDQHIERALEQCGAGGVFSGEHLT